MKKIRHLLSAIWAWIEKKRDEERASINEKSVFFKECQQVINYGLTVAPEEQLKDMINKARAYANKEARLIVFSSVHAVVPVFTSNSKEETIWDVFANTMQEELYSRKS